MLPSWVRFVALFLFVYVLFDVCTPEPCYGQLVPIATPSGTQLKNQHDGTSDGCQFEEDCFACAHYAPGAVFILQAISVVAFEHSEFYVIAHAGIPILPYHPPRA